jgi:prevent-host-death family protein
MPAKLEQRGAEEARNQLPDLLEAAAEGRSTIITRRGRPIAALVPLDAYNASSRQQPLTTVEGSGRGLWGRSSARTIRKLRDEWNR